MSKTQLVIAALVAVNAFAAAAMVDAQMHAAKAYNEARMAAIDVSGKAAERGIVLDYEKLMP